MRIRIIRNGKNLIIGITATLVLLVFLTVFIAGGIQRTRVQAAVEAGSVAGKDYSNSIPIYSVNNDMKQIALTINCAWEADDIPEILDILDVYNIKAAFFVLGVWAEKNPEELKMISERGHEIGNHSYSHKLPVADYSVTNGRRN